MFILVLALLPSNKLGDLLSLLPQLSWPLLDQSRSPHIFVVSLVSLPDGPICHNWCSSVVVGLKRVPLLAYNPMVEKVMTKKLHVEYPHAI